MNSLLTVEDVAERLACSASLVYQLVDAGKIAVHRIGNGRATIRFRPEDVEEYLAACRQDRRAKSSLVQQPRPRLRHISV